MEVSWVESIAMRAPCQRPRGASGTPGNSPRGRSGRIAESAARPRLADSAERGCNGPTGWIRSPRPRPLEVLHAAHPIGELRPRAPRASVPGPELQRRFPAERLGLRQADDELRGG